MQPVSSGHTDDLDAMVILLCCNCEEAGLEAQPLINFTKLDFESIVANSPLPLLINRSRDTKKPSSHRRCISTPRLKISFFPEARLLNYEHKPGSQHDQQHPSCNNVPQVIIFSLQHLYPANVVCHAFLLPSTTPSPSSHRIFDFLSSAIESNR